MKSITTRKPGFRVRRFEEGGSMGDPKRDKLDPKQDFIRRAQEITGRQLAILPQLEGLNYEKLQGMSDDEMQSLLSLVQSVAPEDKSDMAGGISNVMSNLGEIQDVISGLRTNYDLDTRQLLDSIITAKDLGFVKAGLIRGAAKTAGLYRRGGRVRVIKNN
jgi:hypothetical protein